MNVSCHRQFPSVNAESWPFVPLYRVVRIHGSVGWKSSKLFSIAVDLQRRNAYQCLADVSTEPRVLSPRSLLTLDSLRARKELPLCPSEQFSNAMKAFGVPLRRDASSQLVCTVVEGWVGGDVACCSQSVRAQAGITCHK